MSIEVTLRHMGSMENVQAYARDCAQKLMDAFNRIEHVHVVLDHEKHLYKAEVVLHAGHHVRIEAFDELDNMRAAIDSAFEKVERQYRRVQDKVHDHHPARKEAEVRVERGE